jgi:hypothetical protein
MHVGLLVLFDFSDISLGMVVFHLTTTLHEVIGTRRGLEACVLPVARSPLIVQASIEADG